MATHVLRSGYDRRKKHYTESTYRTMTREEVLGLHYGQHVTFLANDGSARILKVNGRVRTWKRDANRVEVPIKYGLYECHTMDLDEAMRRLLVEVNELACGRCGADMALDPFHACTCDVVKEGA